MGKSHSSSGTKSNKKADKSNANVSSNATNGEITSQSQTLNQRNHPMSILKHSEGSRSNASSTSSGFPAASSSSASGSGQPHPNVHYADQPNTSVSHPALMYSQDSQYSNGLSTNTRLSTSSTSSNLNRNGTLSRPLPSNYLSSSLSSSAISNGVSINGSISLTTSQNSTMGRPQVPPSMVNIGLPQPIYMSRTQPIYGATGAPNMARPMLIHPHHPQAQMMSTVQPIYGQTTATPGPVNPTAINAIYGKTGSVYGTYKAYPNSGIQSMPIGRPFTMHASMQPIDGRWSRAASAMPPDEEDIGIMSEAETSSTGFRRSSKIRASLPIVRTMSKTLDRSLGLVFLQYRNVTKRSLLPNEITSMDTVKALYVRSFPRELTMAYFDDRDRVRIYIHDQSKDVFNDLVDLRAIKDRCILRIYEYDERSSAWLPAGGAVAAMPMMNSIYGQTTLNESSYAEEYFSEPEFLMESRTSTVQRKRFSTATVPSASGYYGTVVHRPAYDYKPNATQSMNQPFASNGLANTVVHNGAIKFPAQNGYSATLPRGSTLMNMNTYGSKAQPTPPPKPQRSFTSSLSSSQLNQPLHSTPSGPIAPKLLASNSTNGSIGNNRALPERPYSVAGHYPFDAQHHQLQLQQTIPIRPLFDLRQFQMQPNDRIPIDVRTQHARAVAAAATAAATVAAATSNRRAPSTDGHTTVPLDSETQRLLQQINKYVESLANSVQKSNVSASQSHGSVLIGNGKVNNVEKLLELRRSSKEIANDVKALREWFVTNQQNLNDLLKDAQTKLNQQFNLLTLPDGGEQRLRWNRMRLSREETVYRTHVRQLEQQLCELEASVEELRAKVITHRCKVDMADVEAKALVLNQSSKHLSDLKASFPALQSQLKITMTKEMQVVVDEEKYVHFASKQFSIWNHPTFLFHLNSGF